MNLPAPSTARRAASRWLSALLVGVMAATSAVAAQAQEAPPEETTTTTSEPDAPLLPVDETTTTTSPSTTTTAPPPGPPPPEGQQPSEDAGPTEVPQDVVVVPPPEGEVVVDPFAGVLSQIAGVTLAEVQKGLKATEQARALAVANTVGLSDSVAALEKRISQLETDKAQAIARLQQTHLQMKKRAVAGYMGSPAQPINQILAAEDFNDLSRRFELLEAVVEADRSRIAEHDAARQAVGEELEQLVTDLDAKRSALTVSATVLDGADSQLLAKQIQLAAVRAGSNVVGAGFVFPVGGPHSYSDTFGAARMFGTSYAHLHQGTDIFAARNTPILAVERGVLIKVGTDVLGGLKVWLVGASGTRYYFAHMESFAEGIVENQVVNAGDVLGFVGTSGNAADTPPHTHFEVHPNDGPAVNPYPLLKIVDDAQKQLAGTKPIAPTTTGPPRT